MKFVLPFLLSFFIAGTTFAESGRDLVSLLGKPEIAQALAGIQVSSLSAKIVGAAKCIPGIYMYELETKSNDGTSCKLAVNYGSCGVTEATVRVGALSCTK